MNLSHNKTVSKNFTAPLAQLLNKSERIQDVVSECAKELSSLNAVLKHEITERLPLVEVEKALDKSTRVENKVMTCAEELSNVNKALAEEIKERRKLEQNLSDIVEQEEKSRRLAFYDSLTGLANRLLFSDRLQHGMAQAARHDWGIAVMFLDLDKFKAINDTYGHDVGDKVLQTIAVRLKDAVRSGDTVSRFGGDEFLIIFLEIKDKAHIQGIAQDMYEKIKATCNIDGVDFNINSSIGISIFGKDGDTAEALIKNADKAMYYAKRNRTGYAFFNEISKAV